MANGILWQLVGNVNPLGEYATGLNKYNQQQNILQQLAGQEQDRQFRQETDARNFQRQTSQDAITQKNWEQQFAQNAQNQNQMRAIQQAQLELQRAQFKRGEIPTGFEPDPTKPGALRPIGGGPQHPDYIRSVTEAKPQKPVPFGVQNSEKEDLTDIQSLNTMNSELARFGKLINDKKLLLGPMQNKINAVNNFLGSSDENTRNYADLTAYLEKMRNDSLRLNKGVQTEGDAQRAWNELVTNLNDPQLVTQRLQTIQRLNQQAADFKRNIIAQRREDNKLHPLDFNKVLTPQPNATVPQQQNAPDPIEQEMRKRGLLK